MKQDELLKTLVEELFKLDTTHQEYQDNDIHFVVDSLKDGSVLMIKIELLSNGEKEKFEEWVNKLDDEVFNESWERLLEVLPDANDLYSTEEYPKVIKEFKKIAKQVAVEKINSLKSLF